MDQREIIATSFDLGKFTRACNFVQCERPASVEVLVFELDMNANKRKELASLYLCREHYKTALKDLVEKLNRNSKQGRVNGIEVFDIGYVTR